LFYFVFKVSGLIPVKAQNLYNEVKLHVSAIQHDFIPLVTPPGLLTGEFLSVAATRCPYMHLCAGKCLMKTLKEKKKRNGAEGLENIIVNFLCDF